MKTKSKVLGLVASLSLAMTSLQSNAADVTLNLSNEYSATSIHGVGDTRFSELVDKYSQGEVEVVVHYGGALGYKSADHFDAVAEGALEIADTYGGALGGIDPIFLVSSLPFLLTSVDEAKVLYDESVSEFNKVFEENDQILLYASPWPPSGIWASEAKDSVSSIKNTKIRTYDKNGTLAFNELGASAVRLSWADVVPAVSTNAIEAVLTSAEGGVSSGFWEYFDTFTNIYNYAIPLNFVHMSKDVFDGLTEKQKQAILKASEETREQNWMAVAERLKKTYKDLEQNNVKVVESSNDDYKLALQAAGEAALSEWLESTGDRGKQIIDSYRKNVPQ